MQDKYIGKRLDGRYEIHELVGVGGMAFVYLAYDKLDDRWVAIKILKEEFSSNSDFLRRFRNESKAIALLSCDNIVKIFDVSFGDKIQYIVMEYLDGITLKQYIEQQGTIRWQEAIHFMNQILTALECAHEKGIIHRDIKPQNVILMSNGTIKVTDFGIARFLQSETQTMTTDVAIGSVHYISPEQAQGGYITDRADIYSTGVMMYEMLTGKLPFVADSAVSVALMQLQAKPVSPREINPSIPVGLEQIVMHAMEKNAANRFTSCREMLEDIEKFRLNPQIVFRYETLQMPADYNRKPEPNVSDYATVGATTPDYDDHYEYEEELVKSKRRRNGSMIIVGILAAILLAGAAFGINYAIQTFRQMEQKEDDTLVLPDFVNKNYETEISGNTLYSNYTFKLESGNNPDKEAGVVLKQDPPSGMTVKKGREVTLTINKGEEQPVTVPDLTGAEQTDAINQLVDLGLKTKIQSIPDDNIEEGYVIRTEPVLHSNVSPGSTVILYVSKGKSQRQVPVPADLVGMTVDQAVAAIESAELTVGERTMDDASEADEGIVISVSPESGQSITEGSKVDLVISSGKGKPKQISYSIGLPNVDEDVTLRVYQNGTLQTEESGVNLAMKGQYTLNFTGKSGTIDRISVRLNDQTYMELNFHYDTMTVETVDTYSFVPTPTETPSQSSQGSGNQGDTAGHGGTGING
ncbi:Stk1 family PASTA domain-containing Ser/Thr kinase [Scatolibacter rhodanostii]|uniref:Stk1 family PASTA domain-containing Ser/Thr kinase n=1 Tax=Scatolibacter rhodanostii TaxID=2014781 RepID=UPI000C088F5C|nr:Stk1 family PASTA domain-containing Ser/Thr kinase [Scatolibacter rhodanostii]